MYTFALTALSLLPLTFAAPTPQGFPAPPSDTQLFAIKAVVPEYKTPGCHSDFNNTYAVTYHTGAGFNDVTFTGNKSESSRGFFNTTSNQLMVEPNADLPTSEYIPYTFAAVYGSEDSYQNFDKVTANTGYGSTMGAWFNNGTGIQYNSAGTASDSMANIKDNQFQGWLVCDWWHQNTPQLFYLFSYDGEKYPANCEKAMLIEEM